MGGNKSGGMMDSAKVSVAFLRAFVAVALTPSHAGCRLPDRT
jgi:hypothetical protein